MAEPEVRRTYMSMSDIPPINSSSSLSSMTFTRSRGGT